MCTGCVSGCMSEFRHRKYRKEVQHQLLRIPSQWSRQVRKTQCNAVHALSLSRFSSHGLDSQHIHGLCHLVQVWFFFFTYWAKLRTSCFEFTSIFLRLVLIHMKNTVSEPSLGEKIDHFCLNEIATCFFIPYLFQTK